MINRVLIRLRVVQMLFSSYHQGGSQSIQKTENELLFSLQKSYDLYHYLLGLLMVLTECYNQRLDSRRAKHLPTDDDINPNTRLINNRFIASLQRNEMLQKYLNERPFLWTDHDVFLKNLLDTILSSDTYREYINNPEDNFEIDKEFWRKCFKQIICNSEELFNLLEDESLYWNDDIDIVLSFVLKTIKRINEDAESNSLLPMFKDDSDKEFTVKLLRESMLNGFEYRSMIEKYTKNWESDRIAAMDMVIMQIAVTEILHFPSIPVNVTLNEYIDIAKSYSTQKSASFINGVLDSIVKDLKDAGKIIKK